MDFYVNVVYDSKGSFVGRYRLPTGESDAHFGNNMGMAASSIVSCMGEKEATVIIFSKVTRRLNGCDPMPLSDLEDLASKCKERCGYNRNGSEFIATEPPTILTLTTRIGKILNTALF